MGKQLAEFAEDSYLHGIKQLTRSGNGLGRRIIWGILVALAVSVLLYNTIQQVITFLKYEHLTKYDINYHPELGFPSITVCNMNKHRRSALTKADIAVMGPHLGFTDQDINLLHPEQYPQDWYNDTFLGTDWDAVKAANPATDFDMTDFYNRTAHQFEDLVQHCQWKSQLCNKSSWTEQFTHYGRCFTFNDDGDHSLRKAGAGNGLQLLLYPERDEYLETEDAEDLGVKFLAHTGYEPPFLKELGFGLAPGFHYLVALENKEIKALPSPYGQCVEDHVTTYYQNYTIPGCRIECETELVYEKCGCRLVESPGDHPVCTVEQFDCAEKTLLEIEDSDTCVCQNPCHAAEYPFQVSFLEIRSSTIDKLKKEHPIPKHLTEKDLIILNIYFGMLASEMIEQVPAYTWLDILGDFGGVMGLWLGASVLAAAQLLDYLISLCTAACSRKNQVKESKDNLAFNKQSGMMEAY